MGWGHWGFAPYVSAGEKRRRAEKAAAKLTKGGKNLSPVRLEGRAIARSFWGKAWCDNLESYSDFAYRLPRGRSYVRNGSVVHLEIRPGIAEALVSGSELYKVKVTFKPVQPNRWQGLCRECAGSIGSLMELLQGKLSDRVMGIMTRRENGLFPAPQEIDLNCTCPDWADMCKHVAAALYGVGARLDEKPELLFLLRHANHHELVGQADTVAALTETKSGKTEPTLSAEEIGDVFGIEMKTDAPSKRSPIQPADARRPHPAPAAKHPRRRKKRKPSARTGHKPKTKRQNLRRFH